MLKLYITCVAHQKSTFLLTTVSMAKKIITVKKPTKQVSCLLFLKNSVLYYHGQHLQAKCGCFRVCLVLRCSGGRLLDSGLLQNFPLLNFLDVFNLVLMTVLIPSFHCVFLVILSGHWGLIVNRALSLRNSWTPPKTGQGASRIELKHKLGSGNWWDHVG